MSGPHVQFTIGNIIIVPATTVTQLLRPLTVAREKPIGIGALGRATMCPESYSKDSSGISVFTRLDRIERNTFPLKMS